MLGRTYRRTADRALQYSFLHYEQPSEQATDKGRDCKKDRKATSNYASQDRELFRLWFAKVSLSEEAFVNKGLSVLVECWESVILHFMGACLFGIIQRLTAFHCGKLALTERNKCSHRRPESFSVRRIYPSISLVSRNAVVAKLHVRIFGIVSSITDCAEKHECTNRYSHYGRDEQYKSDSHYRPTHTKHFSFGEYPAFTHLAWGLEFGAICIHS
jgi:hypothetical protein